MAELPSNEEVAKQLELLANVLELEGEPGFRVIAYRRAASRVRDTGETVAELALQGKATELPGIGKIIEEKIVQIVEDGEIEALRRHRSQLPPDVVRFMELPGLGPKTAGRIWHDLGIMTLAELKEAAEGGRLRTLPGLNARTEERVLKALAALSP